MILFRLLHDKYSFAKYYARCLAKRLLFGKPTLSVEQNMITKLKEECGDKYTSKLEEMFNDIQCSQEAMEQFNEFLVECKVSLALEFNVRIVGKEYWPLLSVANCNFPDKITRCCEIFQQFYLPKHRRRNLNWKLSVGTAEIRATFTSRTYRLTVSTYQMCILLLFNKSNELSFKAIEEATNIPFNYLKKALSALTFGKYRILLKKPKTKEMEETDNFSFNENFKCKLISIKLPAIKQYVEKPIQPFIDDEKRLLIEAAIVRIMKARKKMQHNILIAETTTELSSKFYAKPQVIEKLIEGLIEREYLERWNVDKNVYHYLP